MKTHNQRSAFTLIEVLVVVTIIGILATIVFVTLAPIRIKARDTKRKAELSQIGRFLAGSCYQPSGGDGDYDLANLFDELKIRYPQITNFISQPPQDPKTGSLSQTNYHYIFSSAGPKCVLYANLENVSEPVTLTQFTAPTPGGGTGVLRTVSAGWNGTDLYFQFSN